jgi:hypothetical protein
MRGSSAGDVPVLGLGARRFGMSKEGRSPTWTTVSHVGKSRGGLAATRNTQMPAPCLAITAHRSSAGVKEPAPTACRSESCSTDVMFILPSHSVPFPEL